MANSRPTLRRYSRFLALLGLALVRAGLADGDGDVVNHRQPGKEGVVLKNDAAFQPGAGDDRAIPAQMAA